MQDDLSKKLDKWIGGNIAGAAGEKIVFAGIPQPTRHVPQQPPQPKKTFKVNPIKQMPHQPPRKFKSLRIIPLGGLDEVGKNMMVFEYDQDIVIVDMGLQFPEEDMLGIDYVIPDISYLAGKEHRIRGVLITHGHLDHIGAIPYLLPKLNFPPIFTTKLTAGLIKKRLEEFNLEKKVRIYEIDPAKQMRIGGFTVDWFRVNHSIPDGVGIILRTPAGTVVHTGDFKFDYTPVFQAPADYAKIAGLGSQNVIAMFSDSTNALKPGFTTSEKKIGENIHEIIKSAKGRIIIASFASLVSRIQQIVNSAAMYNRKVFLSGRSMVNNVEIARQLAFLKVPPGMVHPINKMGKMKDEHVLILTTGAQGEAMSALTRMALGDHGQVQIKKGDTVVLSSSPIPGNERSIYTVINDLVRLGAHVIFNQVMDVHTSGHAQREDLKLMINLVRPKYLVPVHGELYMRQAHASIGREFGMPEKNIIIVENGDVMEVGGGEAHKTHEKVTANYIMIDGKGIGDVGAQVIMDRQTMAENGMMVVLFAVDAKTKKLIKDPDIISRGFIYMKESQEITKEAIAVARKAYEEAVSRMPQGGRGEIKAFIRGSLDRFSHKKLERHPLVLPVISEV